MCFSKRRFTAKTEGENQNFGFRLSYFHLLKNIYVYIFIFPLVGFNRYSSLLDIYFYFGGGLKQMEVFRGGLVLGPGEVHLAQLGAATLRIYPDADSTNLSCAALEDGRRKGVGWDVGRGGGCWDFVFLSWGKISVRSSEGVGGWGPGGASCGAGCWGWGWGGVCVWGVGLFVLGLWEKILSAEVGETKFILKIT